jgi:hypothetical protein
MPIGVNAPLSEFIAACEASGACQESIDWLLTLGNVTVRQMIEASADVPDSDKWAAYARNKFDLTQATKIMLSERAVRGKPRLAAHYDIHVADTPAEQAMLRKLWKDEDFPTIAEELKSGRVKRRRG